MLLLIAQAVIFTTDGSVLVLTWPLPPSSSSCDFGGALCGDECYLYPFDLYQLAVWDELKMIIATLLRASAFIREISKHVWVPLIQLIF